MEIAIPPLLPESAPNASLTHLDIGSKQLQAGDIYLFTAAQRLQVHLTIHSSGSGNCYINEEVYRLQAKLPVGHNYLLAKGQSLKIRATIPLFIQLTSVEEPCV